MPGYTKADFFSQYAQFLRYPDGRCLAGYRGPEFPETKLQDADGNYLHPPITIKAFSPQLGRMLAAGRADMILAAHIITADDRVLVFGSGFGWTCEELIARTGCSCIGVDLSQYVQDTKDLSPDAALIEAIHADGLSEATGPGLKVYNDFKDSGPMSSAVVLQADLKDAQARDDVRKAFGDQAPTYVVTEDVWQIVPPIDQQTYKAIFDAWGAVTVHFIDNRVM